MKQHTTIFFANPNKTGHCALLLKNVIKKLSENKEFFTIVDLYDDKYDPVMHKNEHYTNGGYQVSKQTKKYRDLITKSTHLIFIHPVWWNSMPAILKGFFDKVFGGRYAFRYQKYAYIPFAVPIGLLKGKKAIVLSTTAARWWMSLFIQHNRFQTVLVHDILKYCGIKSKGFSLHDCQGGKCEIESAEIAVLTQRAVKWLYK